MEKNETTVADELAEALTQCRGQWVHSVNKAKAEAALARYEKRKLGGELNERGDT